jgi:TrmH family RNA methyltransferase
LSRGSGAHRTLARVRRLRDRAQRDRLDAHFIEGVRCVLQAIEAGIRIETLIHSPVLLKNTLAEKAVRVARRAGVETVRVTPEQFRSVSRRPRASGVAAIAGQHWTPLEQVDPRCGLCWLAASMIRSPGNLGTIVRTAEAVGAGGIILLGPSTDPFDPSVVSASMGGLFRVAFVRTELPRFVEWTRKVGCHVLGTSPTACHVYTETPLPRPLIVMLGEERGGQTEHEQAACTQSARIPMVGEADSLNVGVAASVIMYEVLRRGGVGASLPPCG